MTVINLPVQNQTQQHRQRLRDTCKRLVIDLGYLEHWLNSNTGQRVESDNQPLIEASKGLDAAIDHLNDYLSHATD